MTCQLKREGKWKGKLGYLKFKTKRRGLGSFRLTGAIHVYEKAIDLPRLGQLRLKECGYLPTGGVHVFSATVSEEANRCASWAGRQTPVKRGALAVTQVGAVKLTSAK
jgi:hypothetical protein